MNRRPVESSLVASIGYSAKSRTLEVELTGGRVYQYFDVPPSIHRAFMRAKSKGIFFNEEVKGAFHYSQLT